uniref:Metalloendopeptidase n=1 Tax=Biomphalaria glabrata TaxID=6526 RepID=A0A2C9MA53_BIOGL
MHEILHVLGFYHEQNRPDRDLYVDINETNVAVIRDFYIRNETIIDTMGTPYDFESIMHYGAYDAGKVHRYPVITPKPKYGKTLRLGQRLGLSDIDVMKIQMLYHCPIDTSHIQRGLGDRLIDYCDFAFGMCNFSLGNATTGSGPTWDVQNESTPDGPVGGISNGLDPFLFASKEWDELSSLTTEDVSPQGIRNSTTTDSAATTIAPSAISKTPVTVTIYSPLLTSGDDGRACIQFALFQYGPSSYLDVFVSGPLLQRQRLRTFGDVSRMEFWVRYEIKLDMGTKAEFQLEFVAYLLEGTVSLDDYYVVKGNCIYAD